MRIRNYGLERARSDQFLDKLCDDIDRHFSGVDIGLEVSISALLYKRRPVRTLSSSRYGVHLFTVLEGEGMAEKLNVYAVKTNHVSQVEKCFVIEGLALFMLEQLSREVMEFFLSHTEFSESEVKGTIASYFRHIEQLPRIAWIVVKPADVKKKGIRSGVIV